MTAAYPVHSIDPSLAVERESMGSKDKFWFRDPVTGARWLFKYSRPRSLSPVSGSISQPGMAAYAGEHWSEKIAAGIAGALGIPHADAELARHGGAPGVMVRDLTEDTRRGVLIHGNELLFESDPAYPMTKQYRVREHTLDNILRALSQRFISLPEGYPVHGQIGDSFDLFIGYLLLDAIIGNTDRHHENWAIILRSGDRGEAHAELAPSYDHTSSLGRELTDSKRNARLSTNAPDRSVEAYAQRARSALYLDGTSNKPMSTMAAFREAGQRRPGAAHMWIDHLHGVPVTRLDDIVVRVPEEMMSAEAREFSRRMLRYNHDSLRDFSRWTTSDGKRCNHLVRRLAGSRQTKHLRCRTLAQISGKRARHLRAGLCQ